VGLTIPGLRVAPGTYALTFGVYSDLGVEDYVEAAARFDVVTNPLAAELFVDAIRAATIPAARAEILPPEPVE
jgi:hypothetical protein